MVMPVGEAHVQGLKARLSANAAMEMVHDKTAHQAQMQIGQVQNLSQHPAAMTNAKQVYGKFTGQIAKNSTQNHSVA